MDVVASVVARPPGPVVAQQRPGAVVREVLDAAEAQHLSLAQALAWQGHLQPCSVALAEPLAASLGRSSFQAEAVEPVLCQSALAAVAEQPCPAQVLLFLEAAQCLERDAVQVLAAEDVAAVVASQQLEVVQHLLPLRPHFLRGVLACLSAGVLEAAASEAERSLVSLVLVRCQASDPQLSSRLDQAAFRASRCQACPSEAELVRQALLRPRSEGSDLRATCPRCCPRQHLRAL